MSIRVVRLGTARARSEGLRIGTVRRPPRGVRKSDYAAGNWFDVWFPTVAPSPGTMKLGLAARSEAERRRFFRAYRAEMKQPAARHAIEMLAALSHHTNLSVGCYCEIEAHCHRAALRQLLQQAGAEIANS
jgi:uncharacterized protein YeaO (DUF488 family)